MTTASDHEPGRVDQPSPEQPLSELISRTTQDLATLVRKEIELAKVDIREDLRTGAKLGGLFGGAGFAGYLAVLFLALGLAFAIALALPLWSAFVIVGVLFGIVGYVLYQQGRTRMQSFTPGPEQTVETIKEDIQWLRARKS